MRITKPFWLGATLVTQGEYERVMGANPSKFAGEPRRPVEQVPWLRAAAFSGALSQMLGEKAARRRYALPTEAQWEYACRAGSPDWRWWGGQPGVEPTVADENLLGEYAWFVLNSGDQTHPVAQKRANPWGLYDMHGNVGQWCQDPQNSPKNYYLESPTDDPPGPPPGDIHHMYRGASYQDAPWYLRSAFRNATSHPLSYIGLRVACVVAE